ncbi:MAG TPA: ComEC/Rec2 family competence protein, partial [Chitinolyticbacter sp.]|nr:ComEC/Rec2 family competence protein [Chitinolyticbacter sp.]
VLLLLLPAGLPARWLAPVFLLPMLVPRSEPLPTGHYRATVLDVGQGLAVLVETRDRALLYDTGPPGAAQRYLLPSLRAMGVARLDLLVVSHDDNDHAGGADALLATLPVTRWSSRLPEQHPARMRPAPHAPCMAGQRWTWDGVTFEFIWPHQGYTGRNDNAMSCVLRIDNSRHALLLPGDIGRAEELQLVEAGLVSTDIVVAPHHGSRSSSSEALIAATEPAWVAYSAGYLNRFHHPNRIVVERYAAHGAQALRTDHDGALVFEVGDTIDAWGWRTRTPRYWRWQATTQSQ